jgi:hypothetical protein
MNVRHVTAAGLKRFMGQSASLVSLSILLLIAGCKDAPSKSTPLTPSPAVVQSLSSSSAVVSAIQETGRVIDENAIVSELRWNEKLEASVKAFRKKVGPGFVNLPIREQIIAVGEFIKGPQGLGIKYSHELFNQGPQGRQRGNNLNNVMRDRLAVCGGFSAMFALYFKYHVEVFEVFNNVTKEWDHGVAGVYPGFCTLLVIASIILCTK